MKLFETVTRPRQPRVGVRVDVGLHNIPSTPSDSRHADKVRLDKSFTLQVAARLGEYGLLRTVRTSAQ